jgi:uncharacterized C2H2 Zn-finger protein
VCPECGLGFPERERSRHLIAVHGYVETGGTLLPLPAALAALWERVFRRGDVAAHDRLFEILSAVPHRPGEPPPYAAALEAELRRRADTLFASRWQELPRLVRCLRQNEAARSTFRHLLQSTDLRVRETGRELLLPDAAAELAGADAAAVRAWIDGLCPIEDAWEKMRLCQRLGRFGVPEAALRDCLRMLRGERPVACPECGTAVTQGDLEEHLRQAHQIYQFRGVQRSLADTIDVCVASVCGPQADHTAWVTLEELAREAYGPAALAFVAGRLVKALAARGRAGVAPAVEMVAGHLAAEKAAPALAAALAPINRGTAHQLALALAVRLPPPLDDDLLAALQPVLGDKRVPAALRIAATAALLRTTGTEGPAGKQVLQALVARTGKVRSVERLRQLEQHVGKAPAIDELCARLEEKIRMKCPRCPVQLRRPEMIRHVWTQHGLLLHGRRVREPWQLVVDLIEEYRAGGADELLERCRALGRFLDARDGPLRVDRLFLMHALDDDQARTTLVELARRTGTSLCPHCYGLVPAGHDADAVRPLERSHGRLWADGYGVEVAERGPTPWLFVHSPSATVYRGREPDRWWTRRAALLLLAGPPILAAVVAAVLLPLAGESPLTWVLQCLTLAGAAFLGIGLAWRWRPAALDRAVDHGWTLLVPALHAAGFTRADSAFVARLALASINRGRPAERAAVLEHAIAVAERAVAADAVPASHLAALRRLALEDAARSGRDFVRLVAAQVRRGFEAELPLAYAEHLLAEWESDHWTGVNLTRLRVLLCDAAFEAGLEVTDLIELSATAPALGDVLRPDRSDELAGLRLLWSLRPRRPWGKWSNAVTVFDLAAEPGGDLLALYPDLLLADEDFPAVYLCGQGVFFEGRLFTEAPRQVEVKARRGFEGVQYELILDDLRLRFASDPSPLVDRLERWFHYWFDDFLPQRAGVFEWQAPEQRRKLRLRAAVRCPDCGRPVEARPGGVGGRFDEPGATPP